MFQIKHLTLTHKKDNRVILKDFSLTVRPGNRIVLIGEEGNGKSTLLKWMVDPCLIEDYMDHDGERIQTEEHLAYLPQEMPQQELSLSVTEFLFPGDVRGKMILPSFGKEFFPSTVSKFFCLR